MITKSQLIKDRTPPIIFDKYKGVNVVLALQKDTNYHETNLHVPKWLVVNTSYYGAHADKYEGWIELEDVQPPKELLENNGRLFNSHLLKYKFMNRKQEIKNWKNGLQKSAGDRKYIFNQRIIDLCDGFTLELKASHKWVQSEKIGGIIKAIENTKRGGKKFILHFIEEVVTTHSIDPYSFEPVPLSKPIKGFRMFGEVVDAVKISPRP